MRQIVLLVLALVVISMMCYGAFRLIMESDLTPAVADSLHEDDILNSGIATAIPPEDIAQVGAMDETTDLAKHNVQAIQELAETALETQADVAVAGYTTISVITLSNNMRDALVVLAVAAVVIAWIYFKFKAK